MKFVRSGKGKTKYHRAKDRPRIDEATPPFDDSDAEKRQDCKFGKVPAFHNREPRDSPEYAKAFHRRSIGTGQVLKELEEFKRSNHRAGRAED